MSFAYRCLSAQKEERNMPRTTEIAQPDPSDSRSIIECISELEASSSRCPSASTSSYNFQPHRRVATGQIEPLYCSQLDYSRPCPREPPAFGLYPSSAQLNYQSSSTHNSCGTALPNHPQSYPSIPFPPSPGPPNIVAVPRKPPYHSILFRKKKALYKKRLRQSQSQSSVSQSTENPARIAITLAPPDLTVRSMDQRPGARLSGELSLELWPHDAAQQHTANSGQHQPSPGQPTQLRNPGKTLLEAPPMRPQRATTDPDQWTFLAPLVHPRTSDEPSLHSNFEAPLPTLFQQQTGNTSYPETAHSGNDLLLPPSGVDESFPAQYSWETFIRDELERRVTLEQENQTPSMTAIDPYPGSNLYPGVMTAPTANVQLHNHAQAVNLMDRATAPSTMPQSSMSQGTLAGSSFPSLPSVPATQQRRNHTEAFTMENRRRSRPLEYPNTRRRIQSEAQQGSSAPLNANLNRQQSANDPSRPLAVAQESNRPSNAAMRYATLQRAALLERRATGTHPRRTEAARETMSKGLDNQNDGRPSPKESSEMKVDFECQICLSQVVDTVIIPCGHAILCRWCAEQYIPTNPASPTRPLGGSPNRLWQYRIFTP
ncbi:predicted protein [Uncinocarpus reesii 1704]|uniref:RING-type domain-containing protein n=1 Tax=Uncinocarpus reesii (strain UAMH 1704) TaxID=336963 RepID=C4JNS6_UNCRE|nr:uncharacterized protein UREG_04396 [Uncinocarpus reesii 1704]EEP79550.1 predicted protein [Uncinocarpus reesii 1704]